MRTIYLFLICAVVIFSSCSSAYKSGQTPDDVYYSPGNQRNTASNTNDNAQDEYYNANPNDQYLMMRVQDPNRWSTFDNYDYGFAGASYPYSYSTFGLYGGYSPFMTFGYWNPYYSYMNSYYAWNGFYNPYYYGGYIGSPKYAAYNSYAQLRPFNRNAYSSRPLNTTNSAPSSRFYTPGTTRNNVSNGNFRRMNNSRMINGNTSPANSYRPRQTQSYQPTRSYSPPPASSFGSGSGGGRSFSRPGKG